MYIKLFAAVAACAMAAPAMAESPFDGTWKVDVASAKMSQKPEIWSVKDGTYICPTCTPAVRIPADGKVHAVPGHSYFDALSVTVVDPKSVHYVYMKGGKAVSDTTDTINSGGSTLTTEWWSTNNAKGEKIAGKGVMKRTAAAPAGSHATSGSWIRTNDVQLSDKVLTMMLKVEGNSLVMTQPTGETYTAMFGGPKVPLKGDPGNTLVEVVKSGSSIVETDYRRGKAVSRFTMTPLPDGKLKFVGTDLETNSTNEFIGTRM